MKKRTYCRSSKLPQALRAARAKAGVYQKEVADAIGYAPCTIYNHENGKRKPDKDALIAYARYYGEPDNFFFSYAREDTDETDALSPSKLEVVVTRTQLPSQLIATLSTLSLGDLVQVLEIVTQCMDVATTR